MTRFGRAGWVTAARVLDGEERSSRTAARGSTRREGTRREGAPGSGGAPGAREHPARGSTRPRRRDDAFGRDRRWAVLTAKQLRRSAARRPRRRTSGPPAVTSLALRPIRRRSGLPGRLLRRKRRWATCRRPGCTHALRPAAEHPLLAASPAQRVYWQTSLPGRSPEGRLTRLPGRTGPRSNQGTGWMGPCRPDDPRSGRTANVLGQ